MAPSMAVGAGPLSGAPCPLPAQPGILDVYSSSADADRDSFRSRLLGFRINDTWASRKVRDDALAISGGGGDDGGGEDNKQVAQGVEDSTKGNGKESKEKEDDELMEFKAKMMDRYRIAVDNIQRAYAPVPGKRARRDNFRSPPTAEKDRDGKELEAKIHVLPAVDSIQKGYLPVITEKPRPPPVVSSTSHNCKDARAGSGGSSSSHKSADARAGPSGAAAPLPPSKPWNLRKRKPVCTLLRALAAKQHHPQPHVEMAADMSSGFEASYVTRPEKKEKATLLATLTKEEIYHDFVLMTGAPPPRRPRRLPRKVRGYVQTLCHELSAPCVTADLYSVPEARRLRR